MVDHRTPHHHLSTFSLTSTDLSTPPALAPPPVPPAASSSTIQIKTEKVSPPSHDTGNRHLSSTSSAFSSSSSTSLMQRKQLFSMENKENEKQIRKITIVEENGVSSLEEHFRKSLG